MFLVVGGPLITLGARVLQTSLRGSAYPASESRRRGYVPDYIPGEYEYEGRVPRFRATGPGF